MAVLRLFAAAREAAGRTTAEIEGSTVAAVLAEACRRFGEPFVTVLASSKVWVNGEPADAETAVVSADVVAVLPPVSGGATGHPPGRVAARAPHRTVMPSRPPGSARSQGGPTATPQSDRTPAPRIPATSGAARAPMSVPSGSAGAAVPPSAGIPVVRGNLALVPDLPPEEVPAARPAPERRSLAVVHRGVRPHGRLGLAWAMLTTGAMVAGPGWLGAWLAVAAFVAGAQTCRMWRRRGERPIPLAAAAIAAGLPVAASFNVTALGGVVAVGILVCFLARLRTSTQAPMRDIALTLAIGVPVGLAAAAPVLVRQTGIAAPLLLLAMIFVYDASAYLVGTGAASSWEGPAAGIAALIPLTILAEVVLLPPFAGAQPLFLGLLAAVLAPAGPVAASALLGDGNANAPALRRLDSLLLLGPLWAWCAIVFLR